MLNSLQKWYGHVVNTAWKIFIRDLKRLVSVRKVWVILIGVMITPALYSWVNVAAFWDPYGNTENIKVAVVNEDRGASSPLTGSLNIGNEVVAELKENDELGWQFMSKSEADHALARGDVFSSIEIPDRFSRDLLSTFQGTYSQPQLIYRPNEKLSAVAPLITDAGASAINDQITSSFKKQLGETASKKVREEGNSISGRLDNSKNKAVTGLDETLATLDKGQQSLDKMKGRVAGARPTIAATKDALNSAHGTLEDAKSTLAEVDKSVAIVQRMVADFSDSAGDAYAQGTSALAEGTAAANSSVAAVSSAAEQAGRQIAAASEQTTQLVDLGDRNIAQLRGLMDAAGVGPTVAGPLNATIDELQRSNDANRQLLADLNAAGKSTSETAKVLRDSSEELTQAAAAARDSAKGLNSTTGDTLPKLNRAINRLSAATGSFSGSLSSQQSLLGEASNVLDGVDRQIGATTDVIDDFKGNLSSLQDGVENAKTDVLALSLGDDEAFRTVRGLNSEDVGQFMATPATLVNEPMYPVKTYGSGMAALFTNLTLWIGAFVLVVIFRVEVDTDNLGKAARRVSVSQAFWGRFLLLSAFVVGQALIVSIGNLLIGVQTVSPTLYTLTNVLVGFGYLGVIYGLVSALGHIGRGLAVGMAFIQIPGASGLYPIEMTPDFFKIVHPLLPMTYGIDAARETIGGFYDAHYWQALGMLGLMSLVFLFVGMVARRRLSHVNLILNQQLARSGLLVSDKVQVVGSGYRMADVIHALNNHEQFNEFTEERTAKVLRDTPKQILRTAIIGLIGLAVLGVVNAVFDTERATIFAIGIAWALLIIFIIGAREYTGQSYLHAQELGDLDSDELQYVAATQAAGSKEYTFDDEHEEHLARAHAEKAGGGDAAADGGEGADGDNGGNSDVEKQEGEN